MCCATFSREFPEQRVFRSTPRVAGAHRLEVKRVETDRGSVQLSRLCAFAAEIEARRSRARSRLPIRSGFARRRDNGDIRIEEDGYSGREGVGWLKRSSAISGSGEAVHHWRHASVSRARYRWMERGRERKRECTFSGTRRLHLLRSSQQLQHTRIVLLANIYTPAPYAIPSRSGVDCETYKDTSQVSSSNNDPRRRGRYTWTREIPRQLSRMN